ncbi:alpha-ketoacid dehydrogenase subunit beta [Cupriavidus gilardii]|uniref:alpha-ketoacid dehydrogenase subunit beta n=1 Tax=Cupriavidus gilardii TaxID=82541 RepID=UPI001572614B|nr:alpha-ketoacid dehydrogenase subunit beta [Cupriavidus gilardii]NSX03942.1 alpha-ketoacid dehydrogenase subunit beta [Cupriavidus gilardii]
MQPNDTNPSAAASQPARKLTMAQAIAEAIGQEMERDPNVFVMGEDIGKYGGIFSATTGLLDRFGPERIMDTPISETAFMGAAIGAAAEGLRPIAELMFVDFFGVCFDQIYNHLAKNTYMSGGRVKLPAVVMTGIGGGYNDAAQHSQCLYSTFAHMPGMKVVVPSNAYDAKGLMIEAIRDDNPVVFCYHKGIMGLSWMSYFEGSTTAVPTDAYTIPFGKARVVRQGRDVTIVTLSQMVQKSVLAAERLAEEGIDVEVIDLRTLVPLDKQTVLESVARTGRLLIADEDYLSYGLSGEIAAIVAEHLDTLRMKAPVRRLAVPDVPIPFSRPLENFVIPQVDTIAASVRTLMQHTPELKREPKREAA